MIFAVIALGYRLSHQEGSTGYTLDPDGNVISVVLANGPDGKPIKDEKTGSYVVEQENGKDKALVLEYAGKGITQEPVEKEEPGRPEARHVPIP